MQTKGSRCFMTGASISSFIHTKITSELKESAVSNLVYISPHHGRLNHMALGAVSLQSMWSAFYNELLGLI